MLQTKVVEKIKTHFYIA